MTDICKPSAIFPAPLVSLQIRAPLRSLGLAILLVGLAACGSDAVNEGPGDARVDGSVVFPPKKDTGNPPNWVDIPDGMANRYKDKTGGYELPPLACDPGEGCFGDKCHENSDCESGWCVEHLGEDICTQNCKEECPPGWACKQVSDTGPDIIFICISEFASLCRPCNSSDDCKSVGGADACIKYGDAGAFCGGKCDGIKDLCPSGFACQEAEEIDGTLSKTCMAFSGDCPCTDKSIDMDLGTACWNSNATGVCQGERSCEEGGMTDCDAPIPMAEKCNNLDDDCDGIIDGMEEACTSPCGEGLDTCVGGVWGGCSTPNSISCMDYNTCMMQQFCDPFCPEMPEDVCNGVDDDCDGTADATFECPAGKVEEDPCGWCGLATRTCGEDCVWSPWTDCGNQGLCEPGAIQEQACGDCGAMTRVCSDTCQWGAFGECQEGGLCTPAETMSQGCGNCGEQVKTCTDQCIWSDWGTCDGQGQCSVGQLDEQVCGNCGIQNRVCDAKCDWSPWGACNGQGFCVAGETLSQNCGNCGTMYQVCNEQCQWGNWGQCEAEGKCSPGQQENQPCGNCGMQYRSCGGNCNWDPWGSCQGEGQCKPGQSQNQPCGNCGNQTRTCNANCWWDPFGMCTGQGECAAGQINAAGCANSCQAQKCSSQCKWSNGCTECNGCNSYTTCGLTCPSTHHSTSYNYSMGCMGNCCNDNQTNCQPNCGSSFTKCGIGCPSGYHAKSYNYSMSCLGNCCNDNQTNCGLTGGNSFTKCGIGCPSGYHPTSYNYSMSCLGNCCNDNQTNCAKN